MVSVVGHQVLVGHLLACKCAAHGGLAIVDIECPEIARLERRCVLAVIDVAVGVGINAEVEVGVEQVDVETNILVLDRDPTHAGTVAGLLRLVVEVEERRSGTLVSAGNARGAAVAVGLFVKAEPTDAVEGLWQAHLKAHFGKGLDLLGGDNLVVDNDIAGIEYCNRLLYIEEHHIVGVGVAQHCVNAYSVGIDLTAVGGDNVALHILRTEVLP